MGRDFVQLPELKEKTPIEVASRPLFGSMMVKTLYFDESGFTGYNLLDPSQPIFAVASSDVDEQLALDILRDSFPRYQGSEFKLANIWNSGNRAGLLRFAARLADLKENAFVYMIDKRFGVLTKIVDFLIEPIITNAGFDFYQDGFCRKYANYIHFGITQFASPELYFALTNAYQRFSRNPIEENLAQLQWQLGVMAASTDERVQVFFDQMAMGARAFHIFHDLANFKGSDELQLTSMLAIVSHWRSLSRDDFAIIHDASSNFLRSADLWRRITADNVPRQMHRSGDGSFTEFPLRVTSTTPIDSKASRSIQFCDILAGLSTRHFSANTKGDEREFIDEVIDAGLKELSFNGIRPEPVFPDQIPPKPLDGPDVVDQMMGDYVRSTPRPISLAFRCASQIVGRDGPCASANSAVASAAEALSDRFFS